MLLQTIQICVSLRDDSFCRIFELGFMGGGVCSRKSDGFNVRTLFAIVCQPFWAFESKMKYGKAKPSEGPHPFFVRRRCEKY